jgi:hypothetical protein
LKKRTEAISRRALLCHSEFAINPSAQAGTSRIARAGAPLAARPRRPRAARPRRPRAARPRRPLPAHAAHAAMAWLYSFYTACVAAAAVVAAALLRRFATPGAVSPLALLAVWAAWL